MRSQHRKLHKVTVQDHPWGLVYFLISNTLPQYDSAANHVYMTFSKLHMTWFCTATCCGECFGNGGPSRLFMSTCKWRAMYGGGVKCTRSGFKTWTLRRHLAVCNMAEANQHHIPSRPRRNLFIPLGRIALSGWQRNLQEMQLRPADGKMMAAPWIQFLPVPKTQLRGVRTAGFHHKNQALL